MRRTFVVTAIRGHHDATTLGAPGPQFLDVIVDAANSNDEQVTFIRPLDNQPHIGDIVEFDDTET